MFISTSTDLRPIATAHLAQTMHLLELNTAELAEAIASELASNPALELLNERRCPSCGRELRQQRRCSHCALQEDSSGPIVYLTPRDVSEFGRYSGDESEDEQPEIAAQERLPEHVLRQIGPELAAVERPIAAYLLARLDEDGFLPEPIVESARYLRVPIASVERVLRLIQHAEPPGIGAASSRESLLIQLDALEESVLVPAIARDIILECWESLGKLDYVRIARHLRVPRAAVEEAAHFIARNLTPFPAQAFWGSGRGGNGRRQDAFHRPDVSITLSPNGSDGPLIVEVFTPYAGWLRVDPKFRSAVKTCSPEEREEWDRYLERASLFTKCIPQRNHTMRRLMEAIVRAQRDFILQGDRHLVPMTRAALSRQLGVHESTISRAVAHKAVALPDGHIIPLSKFFDRSLSVREAVKAIIAEETTPLTDDKIVQRLYEQGIRIARRTVAKYRAAEGILPAPIRGRVAAGGPSWAARSAARRMREEPSQPALAEAPTQAQDLCTERPATGQVGRSGRGQSTPTQTEDRQTGHEPQILPGETADRPAVSTFISENGANGTASPCPEPQPTNP